MNYFDIIILGAGASGCMCAIVGAKTGKSILIVDRLSKAGKKLMATGNGRCNLSNNNLSPSVKYFNQDIENYLFKFGKNDTLKFFNSLGLVTYSDDEGRIYPYSNSAKSVVEVLNNEIARHKNITLSLENEIISVEKKDGFFNIISSKGEFFCKKLVVATGGKSAENIFEKFDLVSKPFKPSLVALKTQSTRGIENIKVSNVKIESVSGNKKYSDYGEILFKDSGISGIATFNVSTLFARQNNFNGNVYIDLMPNKSEESLKTLLRKRKSLNVKISNFFDGFFVNQLGFYILNNAKIQNEDRDCSNLSEKEIENLVHSIKNISLKVKGHYENNQVHSGGIRLEDLTSNLESKKIKNLYFCGEVCDVDGICGGYNLQWAWTSGHIVGENL